ncbi:hypothetical protein CE10_1691 [Escherichia coli O7:K1 str. CE10]|nr:hypothetical protein CE10_1691 [Escherichia coli O7:K1 str. CE10]
MISWVFQKWGALQEILHISLSMVCKTENKQQIINMKC